MNSLYLGLDKDIELPKGGFLYIGDDPPDIPRARVFDITRHSFNPLKDINYKKARELTNALYAISPQGENTLTVRDGRRALLPALLAKPYDHRPYRFDRVTTTSTEVLSLIDDILASPILKHVLCGSKPFSFASNTRHSNTRIIAKLDRAVIGDFDALVLGLLLINHFKGQIIIPDFGFFGRDAHISLVRENRLIAGVNFLDELPTKLKQACLLIKDKRAASALYEDAVVLAKFAGYSPSTNEFNDDVRYSMS